MWLITTLIAAIGATAAWMVAPKKYRLDFLSIMLWGASIMIFIDHVLGYSGGEFLEMSTEGLITNSVVLGIAMLIPIFIIWEIAAIISIKKGGK
ncbi:MAG: hypothetical protein DRP13_00280 [Candidatus Aenigmatarchaeota archaeon]|nr:MAG: hypothetical protein DRP16_00450 [Candidatus Aenigmarchaeota archaeon]RLJ09361.1 MAG: hypothetical protein DRP13_00280 [Candidatus Aenigmarchaeota archaeon]